MQVGRSQQDVFVTSGVQQQNHGQRAGEALGVQQLRVKADVVVDGVSSNRLPTAQILEAGLAVVLPIRPALAGLAAAEPQVVQVGVAAQAGAQVASGVGKQVEDLFLGVEAVADPVRQRRQPGQTVGELLEIETQPRVNPAIPRGDTRGRLGGLQGEALLGGYVHTGQHAGLQTALGLARARRPELAEPVSSLAALGHEGAVDHTDVIAGVKGHAGCVEFHPVKKSSEPPAEGQFGETTVSSQVFKGRPALVAQQNAEKFGHEFALGLANVRKFGQYWPECLFDAHGS